MWLGQPSSLTNATVNPTIPTAMSHNCRYSRASRPPMSAFSSARTLATSVRTWATSAGTDYTALPAGTLTFTAGATSRTVTVAVTGDTTDEPHETVIVTLSSPTQATLAEGGASGTGTITDDDEAPTATLAVTPSAIAESGTGNVSTVTATLDHRSSAATTVTVGATAGTDTVAVAPTSISENGGMATLSHASSAATTVAVTPVSGLYTVGADATIVVAAGSTANASDTATITSVDDAIDNVAARSGTGHGNGAEQSGDRGGDGRRPDADG